MPTPTPRHSTPISVVINTRNAEEHLPEVLSYLKGFDEVVVCDMESDDRTVEIAKSHGCRVVTFPRNGITICEPARNFAIQSARNEWVLIVDADELIPQALADHLHSYVDSPQAADALMIARRNQVFEGEFSSAYPDYQCRLVRKSKCDWPPTIHAKPIIDGRTDRIDSRRKDLAMIHKPLPMADAFRKMCTYTDNEVKRRMGRGIKRVSMAKLVFDPWFRFFKRYILKGAIFNGKVGYVEARFDYFYRFMALCKIYEQQLKERNK